MARVTGFDHLVLNCADVDASLAWYTNRLGLEAVRVAEWRSGAAPFPSVRIDDTTIIDLLDAPRSGVNVDHLCLVLEPTDLNALATSGRFHVVGEGPVSGLFGARGVATSLYVRDPDDNIIELRCYEESTARGA
jgi:catechol 2,3-dioxygenase-like lactoylglutathione lyase family enzyme